eukprot:RCo049978
MPLDQLLGSSNRSYIIDGNQQQIQITDVSKNDVVAIFFSANWCPPCRTFTPLLIKVYEECKQQGKSFEVVYVSSDKDLDSFTECYRQMPWLALPWEDREAKARLSSKYGVRGIPTVIILDGKGETLAMDGRGKIQAQGAAGYPWH